MTDTFNHLQALIVGMAIASTFMFLGMAVVLGHMGYQVFTARTPFLLPGRQWMRRLAVCFIPSLCVAAIGIIYLLQVGEGLLSFFSILSTAQLAYVCVVWWRQPRGYMALGISEASFREALLTALDTQNIPYEEIMDHLWLTTIKQELIVTVLDRVGIGSLHFKKEGHEEVLARIAAEMNAYYEATAVTPNRRTAYRYFTFVLVLLLLNVGLIVMAVNMFILFNRF